MDALQIIIGESMPQTAVAKSNYSPSCPFGVETQNASSKDGTQQDGRQLVINGAPIRTKRHTGKCIVSTAISVK
jgi:hypothetical protein